MQVVQAPQKQQGRAVHLTSLTLGVNVNLRVALEIAFTSTAVANLYNDDRLAKRKLGAPCARKLRARLKGDRSGQLALEA